LESINSKIKSARLELNILKHNLNKNVEKAQNDLRLVRVEKKKIIYEIKSLKAQKDVLAQDLRLATIQYKRYKTLYKRHSVSKEKFDEVETSYYKLLSQINSLDYKIKSLNLMTEELEEKIKNAHILKSIATKNKEKILSAEENLKSLIGERDYLKEALKEAELNLSYCWVRAPISGYIAGSKLQKGNRVMPAQPLMVIVPLDQVYIEANFKETQLKDIRIGQKAEIKVDMYPKEVFKGRVVGIRAGTGQVFSLLPPENASGNWIKVVQRVPVKIELEEQIPREYPLRIGTSLEVKIDIRDKTGSVLRTRHGNTKK